MKKKYIFWPIQETCFQKKMLAVTKEEQCHPYDNGVTFAGRMKSYKE
jgi:hypothetical protein